MNVRKSLFLIGLFVSSVALAQDEGAVVKKERIERDKSIFVGGGISILGGDNVGDYSNGINFEGGFIKRMNRVFSLGASVSYLTFKYDPDVLANKPDPTGNDLPSNFYYDTSIPLSSVNEGYLVTLSGGDVSLISLALNLKLNFVPVTDNSTISIYGFAKPFVSMATVGSIAGLGEYIYYDAIDDEWYYDPSGDGSGTYDSETSITGGVFIGPGIEINPAKKVSIFAQASFGYTFPINVVSTKSYGNDTYDDLGIGNPNPSQFPLASFGFTSINFAAGISFNID